MRTLVVSVLVSVGLHPVSGRARAADLDRRALELALSRLEAATALHAGPAAAGIPILREYLGMGAGRLTVLDIPPGDDPSTALAAHLAATRPAVIVAGKRAEAGEGSGTLPYVLAERLGYAIVPDVVDVAIDEDRALLVQALPGGRRRELDAPLGLMITVDRTGPEPRLSAFGRAMRGAVEIVPGAPTEPNERLSWSTRPARARPKRLAPASALSSDGHGAMLDPDPADAADAILDFLAREGLFTPAIPEPRAHDDAKRSFDP